MASKIFPITFLTWPTEEYLLPNNISLLNFTVHSLQNHIMYSIHYLNDVHTVRYWEVRLDRNTHKNQRLQELYTLEEALGTQDKSVPIRICTFKVV